MAVPKKKISRSRRGKRRSQRKLQFHGLGKCSNCRADVRPHHICLACGCYNGRQVLLG